MLRIKMSRIGKKNKPMYRIIISERSKDPYGDALEILGTYNPYTKEFLSTKKDRIEYWLSQGAQMTPTVNNLLVGLNVVKGEKVTASKQGKKAEEAKPEEKKAAPAQPAEAKPAETLKEEPKAEETKSEEAGK